MQSYYVVVGTGSAGAVVAGRRVADGSVMPSIVRGHTHAPAVVIGEKAADLIAATQ